MLPSEIVYSVYKPKQSLIKPKCKACELYEALHAGLKSHRSQHCGVKLIDTHCKTVAVRPCKVVFLFLVLQVT